MALLSIAQALETNGKERFDIVAVVQNISTDQIWILDESIAAPPSCVRKLDVRGLAIGNVVRFYGLMMSSHNRQEKVAQFRPDPSSSSLSWKKCVMEPTGSNNDDDLLCPPTRVDSLKQLSRQVQMSFLRPVPCRRRRLCEIQSPGLLSHVPVQVCAVESSVSSLFPRRKRKRGGAGGAVDRTTFATLADKQERMLLMDCQKWELELKSRIGQTILLLYVLSKRRSCGGEDDLVLVPTASTSIIPTDQSPSHNTPSRIGAMSFLSLEANSPPRTRLVVASLRDVSWEGSEALSKMRQDAEGPSSLMRVLLRKKDDVFQYCNGRLRLGNMDDHVHASPWTMQTLCASIDPNELGIDTNSQAAVFVLLVGYIKENIEMKWQLCREGQQVRVIRVTLPTSFFSREEQRQDYS
eukprot:CAMPEP_0116831556 /NCGR_PEP_ID=MMETSP0418-20121206/5404_1 /TAXON_ID=1158023 /ORGANISM="Astrosyne radiata, Strain 13vi08-1A" /LENGTH=408 /DNA_ID=CAMNT_0004460823 /DNA_START=217 /DNA_END=1443 /DNA_ORIENTATION=-